MLSLSIVFKYQTHLVIMFYSVSTKTKQTILTHFLDGTLRLLLKQYVFKILFLM